MIFPENFIEEVKSRVSLSRIISSKVKLKKHGAFYKGLCPFHQEKTPSFTVHDNKAIYYCFGCHASGDVINFITKTENTSFEDTVKYLANLVGLALPKQNYIEREKLATKNKLLEILSEVTIWFQEQLKLSINHKAYEYLQFRGLDEFDFKNFSIGYAPSKGLLEFFKKKKISFEDAVEVGLLIKNEIGYTERFRNRIIFPIKNQKNQIVGFGGRAIDSEVMPKYLNSPETSLFKKSNLLYASEIAIKNSIRTNRLIVVEGYMDAIFMHKAGFNDTVATLGTAFNQAHLSMLWNIANEPILCFDGDVAGKKAMLKAAHVALPNLLPGMSLKFCCLPKKQDPDEIIKKNGSEFMGKLIKSSLNLSEFIWQEELNKDKVDTPESRALFEHRVKDLIKQISNPIVRSHYQQFINHKLWSQFKNIKNIKILNTASQQHLNIINFSTLVRLEHALIAQILDNIELLQDFKILKDLQNLKIQTEELEILRNILVEITENEKKILKDLLIENNLVKFTEFLCGDQSIFVNRISRIDLITAKEIWMLTYKKYLLEQLKEEYNAFVQKAHTQESFFEKAKELKNYIDSLSMEIINIESNLV